MDGQQRCASNLLIHDAFSDPAVRFPIPAASALSFQQARRFAIRKSRGKGRPDKAKQEDMPLMNEHLIKEIMTLSKAESPDQVQLRLVVEHGSGTPPTSEETSLAEAITTSLDLGLDLVEIDLNHTVPVVRAVKYDAKVYRTNKEKAKKQVKDPLSVVKQFRFKARAADHDVQRKLDQVIDALKKGHKCQIQTTCPTRMINQGTNPEGAKEVMERILEGVGSVGEALRDPDVNIDKTHATVLLIPQKS